MMKHKPTRLPFKIAPNEAFSVYLHDFGELHNQSALRKPTLFFTKWTSDDSGVAAVDFLAYGVVLAQANLQPETLSSRNPRNLGDIARFRAKCKQGPSKRALVEAGERTLANRVANTCQHSTSIGLNSTALSTFGRHRAAPEAVGSVVIEAFSLSVRYLDEYADVASLRLGGRDGP